MDNVRLCARADVVRVLLLHRDAEGQGRVTRQALHLRGVSPWRVSLGLHAIGHDRPEGTTSITIMIS